MTTRPVPEWHWRSNGDDPLPGGGVALNEASAAFPSWFLRIECDRWGKGRMLNEVHMKQRDLLLSDILAHAPRRAELITCIEGGSSNPVRKIVLVDG